MAIDFDKINKSVDLEGLRRDVENASANGTGEFPTVPAGKYEVGLVSLEIKGTKKDNRPMLAASFRRVQEPAPVHEPGDLRHQG